MALYFRDRISPRGSSLEEILSRQRTHLSAETPKSADGMRLVLGHDLGLGKSGIPVLGLRNVIAFLFLLSFYPFS